MHRHGHRKMHRHGHRHKKIYRQTHCRHGHRQNAQIQYRHRKTMDTSTDTNKMHRHITDTGKMHGHTHKHNKMHRQMQYRCGHGQNAQTQTQTVTTTATTTDTVINKIAATVLKQKLSIGCAITLTVLWLISIGEPKKVNTAPPIAYAKSCGNNGTSECIVSVHRAIKQLFENKSANQSNNLIQIKSIKQTLNPKQNHSNGQSNDTELIIIQYSIKNHSMHGSHSI